VTKIYDKTGRLATFICLVFCALKCRLEKYVYAMFLSDLVMLIKTLL